MRTFILFLLLLPTFLSANPVPVKSTSKIQNVTVFKNGAQVTRTATISISKGKQVLKFYGLAPSFDKKSLQVKAAGAFTVLAVQHQVHIDTQAVDEKMITRLQLSNDSLSAIIEELELERQVLVEEEALILNNNKNKDKENYRLAIDELRSMAAFYRVELKEIRLEKLKFKRKITAIQHKITKQRQILNLQQNRAVKIAHKEVWVTILSEIATTGKFELSYFVNNAGWIPTYDIRVKDVQNPINVLYKAHVFQHSGEDWDNVKLTLSNADPKLSGEKPILNKWNLGFYNPVLSATTPTKNYQTGIVYNRDGSRTIKGRIFDAEDRNDPLIGASVIIIGTNQGATTDLDGNFEINVPAGYTNLEISYTGYSSQTIDLATTYSYEFGLSGGVLLDEVVVTGYASGRSKVRRPKKEKRAVKPVAITTFQKTTSVEFQIKELYTIKQDGEKYTVTIQELSIPAYYEYYCAPKLEEAVFLTAMISNWEDYNLLSGATSLYFEGTFLGNANLDVENLQDTISLSLGRDKNILVKRSLQNDYTKKQFIGNKKVETKAIKIDIRNKKQQPINLIVQDHFPVAVTDDIEVKIGDYRGANLDNQTKILKWTLQIAPESTHTIGFDYSVKYPKRSRVILD